jgi:xylulokinase
VTERPLLGIDIGTASAKGVLAAPDGTVLATAERPHRLSVPRPGLAEHDPEAVWWDGVRALVAELLPRACAPPRGVCVSGIGPCLLPCGAGTRPLRPAILYGIDARAADEIAELEDCWGAEALLARSGSPLTAQAVGPKLLWLRRHEPDVWEAMETWHMASSFAVARLTGEWVLDHHSASQCDPLYDLGVGDWAWDLADEVLPGLPLPRLAWPGEQVGVVTRAGAEASGLPVGTPVMAGTIDAWAEAFSVGVRRPGDLMLMYGSTMFVVQVVDRPVADARLWATAGVEPRTRSLAAGMATSGSLTGWLRDLAGGIGYDRLAAEAAAIPPGAGGLVVLPYFAGERNPIFDPLARGVIAGLTLAHTRGHLARAVYEGIAFGVRHIVAAMAEAAGRPRRVVAVGGGTKAGVWTQVVSDVTGLEQELPEQTIGAAYGDALLAAIGTGTVAPGTDWTRAAGTVAPTKGTAPLYDELFDVYRELYPATRTLAHRLAAIQERMWPDVSR